jgi:hypothetical protein
LETRGAGTSGQFSGTLEKPVKGFLKIFFRCKNTLS